MCYMPAPVTKVVQSLKQKRKQAKAAAAEKKRAAHEQQLEALFGPAPAEPPSGTRPTTHHEYPVATHHEHAVASNPKQKHHQAKAGPAEEKRAPEEHHQLQALFEEAEPPFYTRPPIRHGPVVASEASGSSTCAEPSSSPADPSSDTGFPSMAEWCAQRVAQHVAERKPVVDPNDPSSSSTEIPIVYEYLTRRAAERGGRPVHFPHHWTAEDILAPIEHKVWFTIRHPDGTTEKVLRPQVFKEPRMRKRRGVVVQNEDHAGSSIGEGTSSQPGKEERKRWGVVMKDAPDPAKDTPQTGEGSTSKEG
ncbi:Uu.00g113400.m01.CDS01 [Anthostomella pinea]|uniref:Uu.00g113400.m01.CDS01 n=1 Tax=Anthostomella pinea TaxID=933095 RepID=A0AAI8YGJ9_9PEZI|nr:Uu.00g113400.m01.CDS01 [Anthostomella pinea]